MIPGPCFSRVFSSFDFSSSQSEDFSGNRQNTNRENATPGNTTEKPSLSHRRFMEEILHLANLDLDSSLATRKYAGELRFRQSDAMPVKMKSQVVIAIRTATF